MTTFELDLLTPWIVGIASLVALWLCAGILLALWHDSVVRVDLPPLVLVLGWLIDRHINPPSYCFDCRRGHHDHDIESGTCRRPDCRCKQ